MLIIRLGVVLFALCLLFSVFTANVSAQVVINEFSSYDNPGDWVELYAIESVDISGWIVRDLTASNKKEIPTGTILSPGSFYVVDFSNYLNRDGDKIILRKADDVTDVDSLVYGDQGGVCAPGLGESAGRYPDANNTIERFREPTKGVPNIANFNVCPTPTPDPTPTLTPLPTPTLTSTPTSAPQATKTATPSPTKTPLATAVRLSTVTPTPSAAVVLAGAVEATDMVLVSSAVPSSTVLPSSKDVSLLKPVVLIAGGVIFISVAGIMYWRDLEKKKKK